MVAPEKRFKLTLLWRWFAAVALLVGLSALYIFSLHQAYGTRLERNQDEINRTYLAQLRQLVDGDLGSLSATLISITGDLAVSRTITAGLIGVGSGDPETLKRGVESVSNHASASPMIATLQVVGVRSGIVITPNALYRPEQAATLTQEYYRSGPELLRRLIDQFDEPGLVRMEDVTGYPAHEGRLLYVATVPVNAQQPRGLVVAEVRPSRLREVLRAGSDEQLLLVDAAGVLFDTGNAGIPFSYTEIDTSRVMEFRRNGLEQVLYAEQLTSYPAKLVRVIPDADYNLEIDGARRNALLSLLAFSIIGLAVAYGISSRLARPIREISRDIQGGARARQDEVDVIRRAIDENRRHEAELETQLETQRRTIRTLALSKWLTGEYESEEDIVEALVPLDVDPVAEQYTVVTFKVNELLATGQQTSELREIQGRLRDTVQHHLADQAGWEIAAVDSLVCLILLEREGRPSVAHMRDVGARVVDTLSRDVGADLSVAVSDSHDSMLAVSQAYLETIEALEYNETLGQLPTVSYRDIPFRKRQYAYPVGDEYKLTNLLKQGEAERVLELVQELLTRRNSPNEMAPETRTCLIFDLMGTAVKSAEQPDTIAYIDNRTPVRRLAQAQTTHEMEQILITTLQDLCSIAAASVTRRTSGELPQRIRSHIQQHFQDPDLNVNNIGHEFGLTPSYLSRLFREEIGDSIPAYINAIRVDEAKTLLDDPTLTVGDIATRVGFTYSNVFIRVFKKTTGLTPGQYRELQR